MFAMLYRYLPQTRTAWRDVWFGAAVTALLFNLGKFLIGLYLGRSSVTEGFGATGSLAVFLLWVYYSAQIFLLGAEFTWVCSRRRGAPGTVPAARSVAPAGSAAVAPVAEAAPRAKDGRPAEWSAEWPGGEPLAEPVAAAYGAGRVMKQLGAGAALGAAAGALMWFVASRRRVRERWLPAPTVVSMPLHARRSP
jgi:membrane protein